MQTETLYDETLERYPLEVIESYRANLREIIREMVDGLRGRAWSRALDQSESNLERDKMPRPRCLTLEAEKGDLTSVAIGKKGRTSTTICSSRPDLLARRRETYGRMGEILRRRDRRGSLGVQAGQIS